MREQIADYRVEQPWGGSTGRYLCRPPARLDSDARMLVTEVRVSADRRREVVDRLVRLVSGGGDPLVQVVEAGPDGETGGMYVATEAVERGTLAHPAEPVDASGCVAALEAVARAVHGLHQAGLAHGGVGPGAILYSARGPVLDLPQLDRPEGHIVHVGNWKDLVTVDPERLAGEAPSRRSDIWSLGATLHAALSPRPLYPGIEADEPVTAVQRVMYTRPEIDPTLDPPLRELIEECLTAEAADRPPTALAVADRLASTRSTGAGGTR